jgi:MerR family mercuric resistance operon transcriptional regulator
MGLTIGQLASKAEINVETVRYYERRGLIQRPTRPASGYRQYSDQILQILLFIKRAKSLGFKLDEIESLLSLSSGHCGEVKLLAEEKLDHINDKITDLKRLAEVLASLVKQCDKRDDEAHCPIIETLLKEN